MSLSAAIDRLTVALTPLVEAGNSVAFSPLCFLHALMLLAFVSDSPAGLALRRELALPDLQDAARLLLAGVDDAAVAAAAAVFARDVKAGAPAPPAVKALHGDVQHLESGTQVNAFVKHATHGEITQIVVDTLGEDVRTIILSTLYFHGNWQKTLDLDEQPTAWAGFSGPSRARYMRATFGARDGVRVDQNSDWEAAQLIYKNSKVKAIFMKPTEIGPGALASLVQKVAATPDAVLKRMLPPQGQLHFSAPRFRITQQLDGLEQVALPAGIKPLLVESPFEVLGESLAVSEIVHKCVIDVDEKGTTAAAATAIVMKRTFSRPAPEINFVLDRPFAFVLAVDSTILFVASVAAPRLD